MAASSETRPAISPQLRPDEIERVTLGIQIDTHYTHNSKERLRNITSVAVIVTVAQDGTRVLVIISIVIILTTFRYEEYTARIT